MKSWCTVLLAVGLSACGPQVIKVNCEENPDACIDEQSLPPRPHIDPVFGLSFSCVSLGCDETRRFEISNKGGGELAISRVRKSFDSSEDFSLAVSRELNDGTFETVELPSGETPLRIRKNVFYVDVTYVPTDAEEDHGSVWLDWFNGELPFEDSVVERTEVPLNARTMGNPVAVLETPTINFGFVPPMESRSETVQLTNDTDDPAILIVEDVRFEGIHGTAFDVDIEFPLQIGPGESADLPVLYAPLLETAMISVMVLVTNDPAANEIEVVLTGSAISTPRLAVEEPIGAQIDLGPVRVGETRREEILVRNVGGAILQVMPEIADSSSAGLVLAPEATAVALEPLESAVIPVEYFATTAGPVEGFVDFQTNDDQEHRVEVRGTATAPELGTSHAALDFGVLALGWTSEVQTVEVYNSGSGELVVDSVSFTTGTSSQFALFDQPILPISLSPGDPALELRVVIHAANLGPIAGKLAINSNAAVGPTRRELPLSAKIATCNDACGMPNAEPSCGSGACAIDSCNSGYHNTDEQLSNGCECEEERGGNDVGASCALGMDLGAVGDNCAPYESSRIVVGNLHAPDDVDVYHIQAHDEGRLGCDTFSDSFAASVTLMDAPPGLVLCANIQDIDAGCGGYTTYYDPGLCGASSYKRDGGTSDDDSVITAWVLWAPGATPSCGSYKLKFEGKD